MYRLTNTLVALTKEFITRHMGYNNHLINKEEHFENCSQLCVIFPCQLNAPLNAKKMGCKLFHAEKIVLLMRYDPKVVAAQTL